MQLLTGMHKGGPSSDTATLEHKINTAAFKIFVSLNREILLCKQCRANCLWLIINRL